MPTFQQIIDSIKTPEENQNQRKITTSQIENITERPLLIYVADINKGQENMILPGDKTGFSDLIENIESENVDIMINSPGGLAEVTESLVDMLRAKFNHIRFIVPNMAKSAATLLVLSGDEILMDHRGELGPIDPQIQYPSNEGRKQEAAEDIIQGFEEVKEILMKEGPTAVPAYVPLLNKYTIGMIRSCHNAIELSKRLAMDWLKKYMFKDQPDSDQPKIIAEILSSRKETLSHGRAYGIDKCLKQLNLKIMDLRKPENKPLSDLIWKLWCLYEFHFERTPVTKIYENNKGCFLQKLSQIIVPIPKSPIPQQPPQQIPKSHFIP